MDIKQECEKYIEEYSELWPEKSTLFKEVLTSLAESLPENVYKDFCENIKEFVHAKDEEKLRLSINLARRMNVMLKGEEAKPEPDNSGVSSIFIGLTFLVIFILVLIFVISGIELGH